MNGWIEDDFLPRDRFSQTRIRRIEMGKRFHCSTKLDRSPAFIEELLTLGRSQADRFLENEPGS